jgi:hypothetical protein
VVDVASIAAPAKARFSRTRGACNKAGAVCTARAANLSPRVAPRSDVRDLLAQRSGATAQQIIADVLPAAAIDLLEAGEVDDADDGSEPVALAASCSRSRTQSQARRFRQPDQLVDERFAAAERELALARRSARAACVRDRPPAFALQRCPAVTIARSRHRRADRRSGGRGRPLPAAWGGRPAGRHCPSDAG